jgi:anthranilate phosphoribosyltransferase
MFSFADALGRVAAGQHLSQDQMTAVMDHVMQGLADPAQIALLLTALHEKGETEEELAGAALSLRRHMSPVRATNRTLVDTCGTGGDGSSTFNISTAAAIVAAAAGVAVAKHGNRSITSKTGSADALAALGVRVDAPIPVVEKCLNELSIGFCFAPLLHPAMKHVGPVRKQLGFPTIFNLLGPLCNPAGAPFQVLGVGKRAVQDLMAAALARLQPQRGVVVSGDDGLDEVTLGGTTRVLEVSPAGVREFTWQPSDFGLPVAGRESMLVDSPAESAALIRRVLSGEAGPPRDVTLLNAAAALWVAGVSPSPRDCATRAAAAIDSGAAETLLTRWAECSHAANA